MSEPSASRSDLWRRRLQRLRARVYSVLPFSSGVFAALVALLVYKILVPGPHQLTARELNDTVAQTLASATPPVAFSARVYQGIQPSLVLIETKGANASGDGEQCIGSGVVI